MSKHIILTKTAILAKLAEYRAANVQDFTLVFSTGDDTPAERIAYRDICAAKVDALTEAGEEIPKALAYDAEFISSSWIVLRVPVWILERISAEDFCKLFDEAGRFRITKDAKQTLEKLIANKSCEILMKGCGYGYFMQYGSCNLGYAVEAALLGAENHDHGDLKDGDAEARSGIRAMQLKASLYSVRQTEKPKKNGVYPMGSVAGYATANIL